MHMTRTLLKIVTIMNVSNVSLMTSVKHILRRAFVGGIYLFFGWVVAIILFGQEE